MPDLPAWLEEFGIDTVDLEDAIADLLVAISMVHAVDRAEVLSTHHGLILSLSIDGPDFIDLDRAEVSRIIADPLCRLGVGNDK